MASPAYQRLLAPFLENAASRPATLEIDLLRSWMRTPTSPGTATLQPVDAGGVPAEWVCSPGADPDLRLLYLHGGGYISGSAATYRSLTSRLSAASGCAVLAADYRLGPEHPFPAALDDAVAAYRWMRAQSPHKPHPAAASFIAGDSAGGGLTLATLVALRDGGAAMPQAAVAISAYTDLAHTGASVITRADADPINRPAWLSTYAANYLGHTDPRHPLASPLYASLKGLPPLLIQAGDAEILRDDSARFAERARAAGVEVTLEIWPEMIHVWHVHEPEFPEARDAIHRIGTFIRSHCAPNP
ncbi:MAG: alpha/beta hydrolase [Lentisphaerae bacterium]|nr:alpha/beta hydrolase [Lentisphaerota bacterium]